MSDEIEAFFKDEDAYKAARDDLEQAKAFIAGVGGRRRASAGGTSRRRPK